MRLRRKADKKTVLLDLQKVQICAEGFKMTEVKKYREIYIKKHIALVDEEDYPFLVRFTWSINKNRNTFYATTSVKIGNKRHIVTMHRMITGFNSSIVDHKNRNGLDNRKENLRFATNKQNSYNRIRNNKHGYRGVFIPPKCKTFAIQIQCGKKRVNKYGFKTAKEAAIAYDKLCLKHHGEFGILNFPELHKNERL